MTQTLATILYSNPSFKLEKIQCAAEIVKLQKDDDYDGMRELVKAHKHYINNRNQFTSKESNDQHALRTLDWLSYMADLLLQGKNAKQAEYTVMVERKQSPQHLWPTGPARKFYHKAADYIIPFGVTNFVTNLDNSVYSMPLSSGDGEERVLFLINRFILSENHAIDYVRNKVIELEELIKIAAVKEIERNPNSRGLMLDGMTKLEGAINTLPEEVKNKLAIGYEDCIKIIRKHLEIPKDHSDYISVKLSVVPKNITGSTIHEARDSHGYDIAMNYFSLQKDRPIWREVIPFDQLAEQEPRAKLDHVPEEKAWFVHLAVADAYSFFSDKANFARLTVNQNNIPEELLLESIQALNSNKNTQSQN